MNISGAENKHGWQQRRWWIRNLQLNYNKKTH